MPLSGNAVGAEPRSPIADMDRIAIKTYRAREGAATPQYLTCRDVNHEHHAIAARIGRDHKMVPIREYRTFDDADGRIDDALRFARTRNGYRPLPRRGLRLVIAFAEIEYLNARSDPARTRIDRGVRAAPYRADGCGLDGQDQHKRNDTRGSDQGRSRPHGLMAKYCTFARSEWVHAQLIVVFLRPTPFNFPQ
jgi:hypothetical protein